MTRFLGGRKDTYYWFTNNEHFNWRAFVYRLALHFSDIIEEALMAQVEKLYAEL